MKIIHVVGARPNFIKVSPLLRLMKRQPGLHNLLVHTGQHYDENMSDVFFEDLDIPRPDFNLGVGSGSHAWQTAQILMRFEPLLLDQRPDLVIVFGDVNSTLACSLAAAKLNIAIAHVEAGVRSFDRRMPEEVNRVLTDAISDLLFTPSREADENLAREGIPGHKVHFVGNVMVDTLLEAAQKANNRQAWLRWDLQPRGYALLTLHRQANVDDPHTLSQLLDTILKVSRLLPVVFPAHPRTTSRLEQAGLNTKLRERTKLFLVEPLGYLDFLSLLAQARLVLTDSGGIQVESTILGVPCLTMRENTEWMVTIQQGGNVLVGTDQERILSETQRIISTGDKLISLPEGWDGQAASRIVKIIKAGVEF